MAVIETKFDMGDVVYHASTTTERKQHPCPDCLGSRVWACQSPAGAEYEVPCPRCGGGYQANRDLNLSYAIHAPSVRRLTIGSVRANTDRDDGSYDSGNSYMCLETGVGSGSVYREADLFATEAEALAAATAKANVQNIEPTGWVAKQYAESVKFSDYELRDAAIKAAEGRAWSANYDANQLVQDLSDAEDMDDVKSILERFKNRDAE
jgi:hypothetical protein